MPRRPYFCLGKLNIRAEFTNETLFEGVNVTRHGDIAEFTAQLHNKQLQGKAADHNNARQWEQRDGVEYFEHVTQSAPLFLLGPTGPFKITIGGYRYKLKPNLVLTRYTDHYDNLPEPITSADVCSIIKATTDITGDTKHGLDNLNSKWYARCVEMMLATYSGWESSIGRDMTMYGIVLTPPTQDFAVLQLHVDSSLIRHIEQYGYTPDGLPERVCKIYKPKDYTGEARFANRSYRHAFIKLAIQLLARVHEDIKDVFPTPGGT